MKTRESISSKRRTITPCTNVEEAVLMIDGCIKRRIFVKRIFLELLEDGVDIEIICKDLKESLEKILAKNGNNKDPHVEVSVWREEKA